VEIVTLAAANLRAGMAGAILGNEEMRAIRGFHMRLA